MSDFKGFKLSDPGLQAPTLEERQAGITESPSPAATVLPDAEGLRNGTGLPTGPDIPTSAELPARAAIPVKSPLPVGPAIPAGITSPRMGDSDWERLAPPSLPPAPLPAPPIRALAPTQAPPSQTSVPPAPTPSPRKAPQQSTFQRAVNVFRSAMPLVQRVLPLLDGNVGSAVSNLMAPRPQVTPPQPPVNLAPLESGLARLQLQHRELREVVVDQNASLKKVEDQLQHVREATDRNTLEQQELLQDLKSVGTKVNIFAYVGIVLLGLSVVLNIVLFVELRRFLH